ncbi:polyphosphate kinase 2 family protein [Paenibacillus sp. HN-1]|uniref:PPK2 family polyphosphate kinase n=1 Tax=Paenibacillus TaxID=44249 RepID=UPI001CAA06EA|nr:MULTISPECIES: PPK2 family polyphosphate kinase [Paenibacillus]MBY9077304.1 polyphosphate kinase 2 family protein [Paenibacillus sp. CGMCC 1.18879]MBY9083351.1 polyphosphate kinase 2 family protein [Paenibacillus sinensis]
MKIDRYLIQGTNGTILSKLDPDETGAFKSKDEAEAKMNKLKSRLAELQDIFFAQKGHALLIVLQGMDSSGKDGTVKHVFSGINPQGFTVTSFKKPTLDESAHDFLWRVHKQTPAKGYISAFNRSHYEDVLVPRVHGTQEKEETRRRYKQIRHFEEMLTEENTLIIKLFLHISKKKQLEKIQERLQDPTKHWKFDVSDLEERKFWNDYQEAYEDIFRETSTDNAPWYWIPANHRWYRNYLALEIVVKTLEKLNLSYPKLNSPTPDISELISPRH